MKKLMLSVFALAAVVLSANAAENVAATAGAELIAPASIAQKAEGANAGQLQFGKLATGTDGTLLLSAVGVTSVTPAAITPSGAVLIAGTERTLGAFTVTGQNGRSFTVGLPGTVTLTGGTGVTVSTFTTNLPLNVGTISTGTTKDFYIGATLNLTSATAATYTGTYNVTIQYN